MNGFPSSNGENSPRDKDSDSSFPVVSIELKGAAGERVRIHLANGSLFIIHAEVFASERIRAGDILDSVRVESLESRSEMIFAREAALRFLSRTALTRRGLAQRLLSCGFSKAATSVALHRMIELGYIDDRAFAENWVRIRVSTRKEGWKSLYRGLLQKGVQRAVAEEVLRDGFPDEVELERARFLVHNLSEKTAVSKLTSRGFRSRTIARILSEMKQKGQPETEE
jgi:regulatory protein